MPNEVCPVCENTLAVGGYHSWHFLCKNCRYEKSNLQPTINLNSSHQLIDESARETGLRELRKANFIKILESIKSLKQNGGSLLDVGCAHGWFLETSEKDFKVAGLEPDKLIFEDTFRRGLPVRMGYFPQALDENEKFDIITFNDVIEHISDVKLTLASCYQRLNKEGILVLNLPSSDGVFYNLSKLFCKLRFFSSFERLWQKGFPSPHLHYFSQRNLIALLENNGFEVKITGNLPAISLNNLYKRISYTKALGKTASVFIYITIALLLPVLKIFPSDIIYVIAQKK